MHPRERDHVRPGPAVEGKSWLAVAMPCRRCRPSRFSASSSLTRPASKQGERLCFAARDLRVGPKIDPYYVRVRTRVRHGPRPRVPHGCSSDRRARSHHSRSCSAHAHNSFSILTNPDTTPEQMKMVS